MTIGSAGPSVPSLLLSRGPHKDHGANRNGLSVKSSTPLSHEKYGTHAFEVHRSSSRLLTGPYSGTESYSGTQAQKINSDNSSKVSSRKGHRLCRSNTLFSSAPGLFQQPAIRVASAAQERKGNQDFLLCPDGRCRGGNA